MNIAPRIVSNKVCVVDIKGGTAINSIAFAALLDNSIDATAVLVYTFPFLARGSLVYRICKYLQNAAVAV